MMTNTAAITSKSNRRANDAYYTPGKATQELLKRVPITGVILEPCAGEHAIAKQLELSIDRLVFESDINWSQYPNPLDATQQPFWDYWANGELPIDWVVTNPPFSVAPAIIPLAYKHAKVGIAFLLRLSYLEPCHNRGLWLAEHPPNRLIVMPRISFTGNNRTDSTTTAWFVWLKHESGQCIEIVPKSIHEAH